MLLGKLEKGAGGDKRGFTSELRSYDWRERKEHIICEEFWQLYGTC